jgi:hypothetical protein
MRKHIVVWLTIGLIILSSLFPPWTVKLYNPTTIRSITVFSFLLYPPQVLKWEGEPGAASFDFVMLCMEWFTILTIGVGLWFSKMEKPYDGLVSWIAVFFLSLLIPIFMPVWLNVVDNSPYIMIFVALWFGGSILFFWSMFKIIHLTEKRGLVVKWFFRLILLYGWIVYVIVQGVKMLGNKQIDHEE